MHALVCFAHIAVGNTFTTAELYPYVLTALQMSADQYSLASLRYDLRKLNQDWTKDARRRHGLSSLGRGEAAGVVVFPLMNRCYCV
jgi:hypothetical protein